MLWVDRFGNVQLNVDPDELEPFGDRVRVRHRRRRPRSAPPGGSGAYADLGPGEIGLVVDSYGLLSLVLDRRSAAEELGLDAGDAVALEPLVDDGADAGRGTAVASPVRPSSRQEPHATRHHHRARRPARSSSSAAALIQSRLPRPLSGVRSDLCSTLRP